MSIYGSLDIRYEKFDKDSFWHKDNYARSLSAWSKQTASVLSVEPEEFLDHPYGVVASCPGDIGLLGYVAIKQLSETGVGQLGALIVNPLSFGNKIATRCVEHLVQTAPHHLPDMRAGFAYANEASKPVFLSLGGVLLGKRPEPAATGCDDVIELTAAMGLPGIETASLADILNVNDTRVV